MKFISVDASAVERNEKSSSEDRAGLSQFHFSYHLYICVAGI